MIKLMSHLADSIFVTAFIATSYLYVFRDGAMRPVATANAHEPGQAYGARSAPPHAGAPWESNSATGGGIDVRDSDPVESVIADLIPRISDVEGAGHDLSTLTIRYVGRDRHYNERVGGLSMPCAPGRVQCAGPETGPIQASETMLSMMGNATHSMRWMDRHRNAQGF